MQTQFPFSSLADDIATVSLRQVGKHDFWEMVIYTKIMSIVLDMGTYFIVN